MLDFLSLSRVLCSLLTSSLSTLFPFPVLSGFTLAVPAGSFTALVGPSGGGKSTVFALLERFYDPASGSVCLDGRDVRKLHLTYVRAALALVGQEPALFTGTIRENVAYGRRDASDAEVRAALDAAQASEFVNAKPEGWLTKVRGERWRGETETGKGRAHERGGWG